MIVAVVAVVVAAVADPHVFAASALSQVPWLGSSRQRNDRRP